MIAAAHLAVWRTGRALRAGDLPRAVLWLYAGYAAAVCLAALVTLPIVDRWQDLPALARRIHADTAREPLALLDPDETTIAILDRGLETRFTILTSGSAGAPRVVSEWFITHGREARVLVLLPGHAPGPLTPYLARLTHWTAPDDGVAGRLVASGTALLARRYELPHGRRYALLAPPS